MANYPAELQLESPFGNFRVPVEHSETVPSADVLWIAVKATQLDAALASFPDGNRVRAIVPLLNGIDHVARLRSQYGAERVIPATIAVEAERIAPGHMVHRSPFANLSVSSSGQTVLGETVSTLAKMGFSCRFVESEATLLWSKLVFLAPMALNTTASGKVSGELVSDAAWRERLYGSVREAAAVAAAEGAQVDAEAVIAVISKLPPNMRSSMQKDVAQGNPPELDAVAGPILRGAARHGIEIPITRDLVGRIERKVAA